MEDLKRAAVPHHDPEYQRPINSRYVDPVDVIWLSTATRLQLKPLEVDPVSLTSIRSPS